MIVLLFVAPASAQKPFQLADVSSFPRPKLAADADTNSWSAYFSYGVAHLRSSPAKAEAAFVWASRIDPSQAEPYYARWIAYWRRYPGWFEQYLIDPRSVVDSTTILQVDSLMVRATIRNPLVRQDLDLILYEQLTGGRWSRDRFIMGHLAYAEGRYHEAVRLFTDHLRKDSTHNYSVRFDIALCYTAARRFDSAASEITELLGEMRRRSEAHVNSFYKSRELFEYSLALLHQVLGHKAEARVHLGQALTENLAFYPAHAQLGDFALADGDSTQAVLEYSQAIELAPNDGVIHYRYARVLSAVNRLEDAEVELRRAIALEPYFAPPYLGLALVLENRASRVEAAEMYRRYLDRTYRSDPRIDMARSHLAALSP